ncbi:MAG: O-antigen ligase family protein [Deltaproteobacteria bacterium]|jgi:O-antigen ligase|nr:O-antigen ligase family protein [Deltaproteobacteria bacterium]
MKNACIKSINIFSYGKRETTLSIITALWLLLWALVVLKTSIEWVRFSLLALVLALAAIDCRQSGLRLSGLRLPGLVKMRSALLFVACLLGLGLFTAGLLLLDEQSLRPVRNWFTFCVIGLGVFHYLGWRSIKISLLGICAGVLVSVPLLLVWFFWPEYSFKTPVYKTQSLRLALFMDHPNDLGPVMAWGCCLWFFLRLHQQYIITPKLDWLLLPIMAVPLYLSVSRGGMFAGVFTVLFIFLCFSKVSWKKFLLVGLSLLFIVFLASRIPLPENPRLARIVSAIQSPVDDTTIQSRLPLWEIALHNFAQSPIYGNGVESYTALHEKYLAGHLDELKLKYPLVEKGMHSAHNIFLSAMSDTGAIGLLLLVGLYVFGFMAGGRVSPPFRIIWPALLFSVLIGLTSSPFYEAWMSIIMFTSGGAMLAGYLPLNR